MKGTGELFAMKRLKKTDILKKEQACIQFLIKISCSLLILYKSRLLMSELNEISWPGLIEVDQILG